MFRRILPVLAVMMLAADFAVAKGMDDFLGEWALPDNSMSIRIIKEGELYQVIEFVRIKHELFFSGDGARAMFIEYGKGPGWETTMLQLDGNTITYMYFSEKYRWEPSRYIFYKRP